jgi:hypothetical protein
MVETSPVYQGSAPEEVANAKESARPSSEPLAHEPISECRLMLRFARENNRALPEELLLDIATLDTSLVAREQRPISDLDPSLIGGPPPRTGNEASLTHLVLKVHAALSDIVAPATALSLQVSEPPPGRHRFMGGMPLIVKGAALVALLAAVAFVGSAGYLAKYVKENPPPESGKSQQAPKATSGAQKP